MSNLKNKDKFDKFVGKVELNEALLTKARGGQGSGWVYTVSGECSPTNPPTNCRRLSTWLSPLGGSATATATATATPTTEDGSATGGTAS